MTFTGPQFLALYAALAVFANWWLRRHYRTREAGTGVPRLDFANDPYQIAFLHQSDEDVVHLVIFSLVDRGLLEEADGKVRVARPDARAIARRTIEQAVLDCYADWAAPERAVGDPLVRRVCDGYIESLAGRRFLAGSTVFSERKAALVAALGLTLGIAGARLVNAFAQGRHNVAFLVVLALVAAGFLVVAFRRRRTGLGDATLDRLNKLFAGLKQRARQIKPGGASHDAVVFGAMFGLTALPTENFPFVPRLFKKKQDGDSDSGGSSSSGDGGSCDSGGCGGGGCGGGCGG